MKTSAETHEKAGYPIDEAAERIGVTTVELTRARLRGDLPAYNLGRWYFRSTDLDQFSADQKPVERTDWESTLRWRIDNYKRNRWGRGNAEEIATTIEATLSAQEQAIVDDLTRPRRRPGTNSA